MSVLTQGTQIYFIDPDFDSNGPGSGRGHPQCHRAARLHRGLARREP